MASGSVFSETLQTITNTKLEELAKQRQSFEEAYATLLHAVETEQDRLKRLVLLLDGTKSCLNVKTEPSKAKTGRLGRVIGGGTRNARLDADLKNIDRFIEQAQFDPSISEKVFENWQDSLLQYLSVQSSKFQYADLYGKLVTEWLSSEKKTPAYGDVEMAESFEELPGAKKLEARKGWEKRVFEEGQVDVQALNSYLEKLFISNKKDAASGLRDLKQAVEEFETELSNSSQFNVSTLRWVIKGLAASDLLSNEKREALKDFLSNDVILNELADVLNMRMIALDRWTWGEFVALEQRRKINGGWSIHMDAEVLQAIFLHYIGVKWSVFLKESFTKIRDESHAWKSNHAEIPKSHNLKRTHFLGHEGTLMYANLEDKRSKMYQDSYFAHQLLDHEGQQVEVREGEEEAEDQETHPQDMKKRKHAVQGVSRSAAMPSQGLFAMQSQSQMRAQMPDPQLNTAQNLSLFQHARDEQRNKVSKVPKVHKRPIEAKQGLLHLLSTEIILNTSLYGSMSCFRTVFESWNPLLPHQSVLSVLKFFGVSDKWIRFFTKFLQAPLKFTEDGPFTEPRLRRRGTPGSYALSDVLGEAVLFCLDFAVNQDTDGAILHRMYDDLWFWHKDYEVCVEAWSTVNTFVNVMGVELSNSKTGSICIPREYDGQIDRRLPEGKIRWGFLYLHPTAGRFEIDQKMVDSHIEELRKQLQGKKSVIDWIQAYNSYAATFFSSNFGTAANCFGREHVDQMLATHRHVQETLFNGRSVVQYLRDTIQTRFEVSDIPDGFLFFPIELGGLDLKSPFVNLLQIRESVQEDPWEIMAIYKEYELDAYANRKAMFDRGDVSSLWHPGNAREALPGANEFFSFDDFILYREEYAPMDKANLLEAYEKLLQRPTKTPIDISPQVQQALDQLQGQANLKGITSDWHSMDDYWRWIAELYGPEMTRKFGGLNVVDPGLLPVGMVGFFRERRTKWQG